jgi:hypothetical protein
MALTGTNPALASLAEVVDRPLLEAAVTDVEVTDFGCPGAGIEHESDDRLVAHLLATALADGSQDRGQLSYGEVRHDECRGLRDLDLRENVVRNDLLPSITSGKA